ncbi:MAG TPA: hypothetical protein VMX97_17910, partial [Hyphomicrobiaceae bacterium]|nr:hypothetical protein [Hyphomicrobiaceae bacterium]
IELILRGLLDDHDGLLVQAVERDVVVANTALRWFKQRRAAVASDNNVVVFPVVPEQPITRPAPPAEAGQQFEYAEAS